MALNDLLKGVELFDSLTDDELSKIASICQQRQLEKGEILTSQGDIGEEFFLIKDGVVEILISEKEVPVIILGAGQIIGEMSLVDTGKRSATVRAKHNPTHIYVIKHADFRELCERDTRIGYVVMRNIAADLSVKMRHHNLVQGQA